LLVATNSCAPLGSMSSIVLPSRISSTVSPPVAATCTSIQFAVSGDKRWDAPK
jgi:hypothetical protein